MLTERLNCHNFFYYINHTQSEKLDPQDRTKALMQSIFIGFITAGFAQLFSLIYYSRFCQCCRVKTSSSLNISLPTPPPIHVPQLSPPPPLPAPEFLSEINRKNKQKKPISDIKIPRPVAETVVTFIGFNKTDLHNLALASKEWKAAVNSFSPMRCLSFIQQMRQKMQPKESQEVEPEVKEKLSKDWDHVYKEIFSERAGISDVYAKVDPDYAALKQLLRGECDPKLLENKAFKYLITENVILLAKAVSTHPEIIDLISPEFDLNLAVSGLAKYFCIISSRDRAEAEKADPSIIYKIDQKMDKALRELALKKQTNKDIVFAVAESDRILPGHINPIFLKDEDIAFSFVRQIGVHLRWVDSKFRSNWKFVRAALDNSGHAKTIIKAAKALLGEEFDSNDLHGLVCNKAVMLAAVAEEPQIFRYIDIELWEDPEVVAAALAAIAIDRYVYLDVSPTITKNIEFAHKAYAANKSVRHLLDKDIQVKLKEMLKT